ncbi:hypothetical protein [Legionella moravica]|uniref:hypothetical protein n=1 Tax=Legionella moravica TaxID=39962 RepID=UPI0003FEB89C|nr:hypothetical protein [Legionella moravica]
MSVGGEQIRPELVVISLRNTQLDYFESKKSNILELQKLIDQTDEKIDKAVYELYGLTGEEINLIENTSKI